MVDTPVAESDGGSLAFLRRNRRWRIIFLIIIAIALLLTIGVVVFAYWLLPEFWAWGFHPGWDVAANYGLAGDLGRKLLCVIGSFLLVLLPPLLPIVVGTWSWNIVTLYFDDADLETDKKVDKVKIAQQEVEDALKAIEGNDLTGLTQLARYSRLQLEQYYDVGLRQTRQSFRYSVVAMWVGFVVMISGMLPIAVPSFQNGGKSESSFRISALVLAGGLVIELISALFLWVYRNSIAQLTYFYNRQIHLHNVLLCFRISANMKIDDEPKSLEAKSLIIQKVLESAWTLERPDAPSSRGIRELLGGGPKSPSDAPTKPHPAKRRRGSVAARQESPSSDLS
jgi:hypothetical protein